MSLGGLRLIINALPLPSMCFYWVENWHWIDRVAILGSDMLLEYRQCCLCGLGLLNVEFLELCRKKGIFKQNKCEKCGNISMYFNSVPFYI